MQEIPWGKETLDEQPEEPVIDIDPDGIPLQGLKDSSPNISIVGMNSLELRSIA